MIIVTGGAGFIGSNIVKALNNQGITDILIVDNLQNSNKFKNLVDLVFIDYIDKVEYLNYIKEEKKLGNIEAIFHQGACSSTLEYNGNYLLRNNYRYSKELLYYCQKRSIPFLYASSAAIYGNRTSNFIESRQYEKPENIYAYFKFLFDEHVRYTLPKAKSQIVGLRYFNVYGPREDNKGSMSSIIYQIYSQIQEGKPPVLFEGSEGFKRDFIYVDDIVSANLWYLKQGISGIFNLGTGYSVSFQEIAKMVLTTYYNNIKKIEYLPFPSNLKGRYQMFTQANLTNLRSSGYYKSFKTVQKGIKEYITWLKSNNKLHKN